MRLRLAMLIILLWCVPVLGQSGNGPTGNIPQSTYTTLPTSNSTIVNGAGTNPLGASFNVKAFGAIGDAKHTNTCSIQNGLNTITDTTSSPFLSTDVGKKIYEVSPGFSTVNFTPAVQTITGFVNSTQVTVTNNANVTGSNLHCVWFTQKEDTAFAAALAAAQASLTAIDPGYGSPTLAYASNVYCPPGGYVLSKPWLNQNYANANTQAVGFIGAGQGDCQIYMTPTPDYAPGANAYIGYINQGSNFTICCFSIEADLALYTSALPGLYISNSNRIRLQDFNITDYSNNADTNFGLLYLTGGDAAVRIDKINLQDSASGDVETAFNCNGASGMIVTNSLFSNKHVNLILNGCGARSPTNTQTLFEGDIVDECSAAPCTVVSAGTVGNFVGGTLWGELSVDGTSSAYLNDMDLGQFNGVANVNAITISSGGLVEATGSNIRGNGTSAAVNGPPGATFVSVGGNKILNCSGLSCSSVTAANYSTLGFSGGIVPKSTETHTPNTCYVTITPIVNATTYTACNSLLDQNYQIMNIAASSVATTTCATAPIVTISDGTQSATLTLTSGQNSWKSSVDTHTGINNVFASGNVMTVKYDAGALSACATPPTNLAISYILQSVLNF